MQKEQQAETPTQASEFPTLNGDTIARHLVKIAYDAGYLANTRGVIPATANAIREPLVEIAKSYNSRAATVNKAIRERDEARAELASMKRERDVAIANYNSCFKDSMLFGNERNELCAHLEMLTFACEKYAEERAAHQRACDSNPKRQFAFLKERMWECRHLLSRLNTQGGAQ